MAASSIRTRPACSICRCRAWRAATSTAMPASPSPRSGRRTACAVSDRAIERAMQTVDWPARLQRLTSGRIAAMLPPGTEIWLDGGHNVDGGRVLAEAMAELEDRNPRPLLLVAGMLSTKDSDGFLNNFAGLAQRGPCRADHRQLDRPPARGCRRRRPACRPRGSCPCQPARGHRGDRRAALRRPRRASSSPARSISPARSWRWTGRMSNSEESGSCCATPGRRRACGPPAHRLATRHSPLHTVTACSTRPFSPKMRDSARARAARRSPWRDCPRS